VWNLNENFGKEHAVAWISVASVRVISVRLAQLLLGTAVPWLAMIGFALCLRADSTQELEGIGHNQVPLRVREGRFHALTIATSKASSVKTLASFGG
jgi:hypothetical protein